MSGTFTATPVEQQAFTEALDGDLKDAASVLVFLQGLADGLAAQARIAFDWHTVVASTFAVIEACFDHVDQAWWVVGEGSTDQLQASWDRGRSWHSASIAVGVTLIAVASDPSGNVIAVDNAGGYYFGTRTGFAALTWTHLSSKFTAAPTGGDVGICYDAVSANFFIVYAHSTASIHADYDNGSAWVAATIPASWTATSQWASVHVNCNTLGTSIAAMCVTLGGFLLSRSTDGGRTWVDPTTVPTFGSFLFSNISRPTYDPVLDEWYVAVSTTAASNTTKVLRSTDDGVTWANTGAVTPDMALVDCVAINGILVGLDYYGRIYRSVDRGVTWSLTTANSMGNTPAVGNLKLRHGDGQLLEISRDDSHVCASTVLGAKGATPA